MTLTKQVSSRPEYRAELQTQRLRAQRGATMVSVLLLTVSLMTVAVLVIRSSNREVSQANALVARERGLMAAQATIELGAAQLRQAINQGGSATVVINQSLIGYNNAGSQESCTSPFEDCIPGGMGDSAVPATGQKNRWVTGKSDCAGRPCMRQGAIAFLPNSEFVPTNWVQVPLRELLAGGDSEARVSLWIRNNAADAVDSTGGGSWTTDTDGRVVLTAMATIRNTTVAVEQEIRLTPGDQKSAWSMATPDVAYGGGHNNDNVMADVCVENSLGYEEN
jgi:Tfp pilus assembly protein PilX